jgi:adenosylhomocysteine nucleosidase
VGLALEARAALRPVGRQGRRRVRVVLVGPGATALDALDRALGASRPEAVLAAGLAGGCAPGVASGDIVVGDPVGLPGPTSGWGRPDERLRTRAVDALGAAGLRYRVGPLLTVDHVVATSADKARWWATHGAVAVDMESAHVLAWAERVGVPALAVRAVADGPADEVPPELLATVGEEGRLRAAGVAALFRRPSRLGAAWRLGRRSHRALARLGRFLQVFLAPPVRP